jgi:hypothetical protein
VGPITHLEENISQRQHSPGAANRRRRLPVGRSLRHRLPAWTDGRAGPEIGALDVRVHRRGPARGKAGAGLREVGLQYGKLGASCVGVDAVVGEAIGAGGGWGKGGG